VTAGPKNYAYKSNKPDENAMQTVCNVRGITLNYKNSLSINFDTIREMVVFDKRDPVTVTDDFKIGRHNNCLLTTRQDKDYKLVFDKRVIGGKLEDISIWLLKRFCCRIINNVYITVK